jgi:hypothetical protein
VIFFLIKHHAMKAFWGSGDIASRILDLGTRWSWVVNFTSRLLYPQWKSPSYSLDRRPVWTRWWGEKFPAPNRNLKPWSSSS